MTEYTSQKISSNVKWRISYSTISLLVFISSASLFFIIRYKKIYSKASVAFLSLFCSFTFCQFIFFSPFGSLVIDSGTASAFLHLEPLYLRAFWLERSSFSEKICRARLQVTKSKIFSVWKIITEKSIAKVDGCCYEYWNKRSIFTSKTSMHMPLVRAESTFSDA